MNSIMQNPMKAFYLCLLFLKICKISLCYQVSFNKVPKQLQITYHNFVYELDD